MNPSLVRDVYIAQLGCRGSPCTHVLVQILYSLATQRFSRSTLFNIVIATFMVWFVAFGLLYPHHETVHFHGFAEDTLKTLPSGLAGAVGMVSAQPALASRCI